MSTRPSTSCNLAGCASEDLILISLGEAVRGKVICPACNGIIALSGDEREGVFDYIDNRADKLFEPEDDGEI